MACKYPTSTAALVLSVKLDLSAAGPLCRHLQSMPGMPTLIDVTKIKRVGAEPERRLPAFENYDRNSDIINPAFHAVQPIKGAADDAGAALSAAPGELDLS
jgi:hypothetical protein